ncbi:MAG: hypothetical protein LBS45_03980 [Synergistaceae bacterium]|jgi:hypothetical protein|nr:hypothetical protein [Synergistaceae bacterium]
MTFEEICEKRPEIRAIIKDMGDQAAKSGYHGAYSEGKSILSYLVGHFAHEPELKTIQAYDTVIEQLIEACERGAEIFEEDSDYWETIKRVMGIQIV